MQLPTFDEVKEVVGFNDYYKEEERYASSPPPKSRSSSASARPAGASQKATGTVDQNAGGPDAPKAEAPKATPKSTWAAPPPPSADEIAERRAEWGLGSSPASSSSTKPSTSKTAVEASVQSPGAVSTTDQTTGGKQDSPPGGTGADSVRRLDGTLPGERTAAEAALKTAEDAAAAALQEAERLINAAAVKKAGGQGASDASVRKGPSMTHYLQDSSFRTQRRIGSTVLGI